MDTQSISCLELRINGRLPGSWDVGNGYARADSTVGRDGHHTSTGRDPNPRSGNRRTAQIVVTDGTQSQPNDGG